MYSWWNRRKKGSKRPRSLRARYELAQEDGSSLIETALVLPLLILILVVAVDFGRAYWMMIAVNSAAEAGAVYGVQNPGDAAGMVLAATADAVESNALVPVASYGCECSDGSGVTPLCTAAPTCSSNVVNYVEVDTTAVYVSLLAFPGVPNSITMNGKARLRVAQ